MNKKGGYQIIDLKDFNFTKDTNEYKLTNYESFDIGKRFFNNIFGKDKKPILITNIVINGVEKNDVILDNYDVKVIDSISRYFTLYNYKCSIYNDEKTCYFYMTIN